MTKKRTDTTLSKNALHTWQFWLICFASLAHFIDVLPQWFLFKAPLDSFLSLAIGIVFGAEAYSRLKYKKTYMGQRWAVGLSIIVILSLLITYILP